VSVALVTVRRLGTEAMLERKQVGSPELELGVELTRSWAATDVARDEKENNKVNAHES
jgi:hypothetical protein